MIDGNIKATIQTYEANENAIGEKVKSWQDRQTLTGHPLRTRPQVSSKVQESTHVFLCDYVPLDADIKAENARMVIGGKAYDIMLIDNPMELCQQLEIYLKYTGGL